MAYLFASFIGIRGIFVAQVVANILAGIAGIIWYRLLFRQLSNQNT
jgi:Na+-driven multidrug efflux pump